MTKEQILRETAAFYNSNNRSTDGTNCLYLGPDGKQCAFARVCIEPSPKWEHKGVHSIMEKYGRKILKPEYRGHQVEFWTDVQNLHDYVRNWDENGLSNSGKNQLAYLIEQWRYANEPSDKYI